VIAENTKGYVRTRESGKRERDWPTSVNEGANSAES